MATAFEYVTDVLEIVKEPDENDQYYFQRVAFGLQSLSEDEWNNLPSDLQDWYNKAADVIASAEEETGEIEAIPGMVKAKKGKKVKEVKEVKQAKKEVDEEEDVEELETSDEVVKPKRGRKPKAEKVAKEPKPKKEKAPKGPTAANAVREILCENMDLNLDEIMTELEKRGVAMQRSSMQVVALNTKQAFAVAIQVGEVKDAKGSTVLTAS